MKKICLFISLAVGVLLFNYCTKDIIAADITKKTVNILAPGNGVHTPYNSITFWWDEVKDADNYQLQIVSPSFTSVINLVADTTVTSNKFTLILNPGTYEWRVRASNNAGSTAYSTRSFVIDTTNDMTNITVALMSPADSTYSANLSQTFTWASVSNATQYKIDVLNSSGGTLTSSVTTGTSFAYTFSQEGTYTWKVRAENQFTNSAYSSRILLIDQTVPSAPVLLLPVNNATLTLNDSLKWNTGSGGYFDSLLVASDSTYASVLVRQKMNGTIYQVTSGAGFISGTNYFWKASTTDKAGNTSVYSTTRKFKAN